MVLLVAYGGGHVAMLASVAQALHNAGRKFTFLGLTTARAYLTRKGIPSIGFRDLPAAQSAQAQKWGELLVSELPPGGVVAREESVAYLGLCFLELVQRHGEEEAMARYRRDGRQAFLPIATMRSVIEDLRPDLLVATNSPRAERAALLAAGELGVPAVCVVDLFAMQEMAWIGKHGYAQRLCVLNDQVKQRFVDFGRKPEEIIVTGNPAFDSLFASGTVEEGVCLRSERGWSDDRITVLWASQTEPVRHPFADRAGDPTLPARIEAYLREFVTTNLGYRLVVRYHPSERTVFVPQALVELSPVDENLGPLLHAVDIVVVTASTVGLEASLVGRTVISVDDSIFTADAPYSAMGISKGVPKVEALGVAIAASVGHRGAAGMRTTGFRCDVMATQKVLQVMDSLL